MANGQTTTTTPGMQAASQTMEQTQTAIKNQRQQVLSHLQSLAGTWTGEASTKFQASCQPWFEDVDRILNALERQQAAIDTNRQNITQSEQSQSDLSSGMASSVQINF